MKLTLGNKVSYGLGAASESAIYSLISSYFLFFLTQVAGVNAAIAGTIAALGSIFEAIGGPIFGYVSDRVETRFGKRKPFLLVGAIPIAVITSLLFTVFDVSPELKIVYYVVLTLLFWVCFSSFFVPYLTWGSELTTDYDERTSLRSFSIVFDQLGAAIALVLPIALVDYLMNLGYSLQSGWQTVGIAIGSFSGITLLLCALTNTKTDIKDFKPSKNKKKIFSLKSFVEIFKNYITILKLKPMLFILFSSLSFLVADTMFLSDRMYFMTYFGKFTNDEITSSMFIIIICSALMVPVIAFFSKKFDKKNALALGQIIGGTGLLIIGFTDDNSFLMVNLACGIYVFGHTCYWQLMPSINYDICEVQEFYTGEKQAGAVVSLQALSESISIAIGAQILGIILDSAGFISGSDVQTESAIHAIDLSFTFIPALFMILSGIIISRLPLNHKIHKELLEFLDKRHKGVVDEEQEAYLCKKMKMKKPQLNK